MNEERSAGLSCASESDSSRPGDAILRDTSTPHSPSIQLSLKIFETAALRPDFALNIHELELMLQWCNSTHHTLSREESANAIWRNVVPKEALSHPFLMRSLLALSALHLSRTGPKQSCQAFYLNLAVVHQNHALALLHEILSDINVSNARAVFACAEVVIMYAFGFPQTPDAQDPWTSVEELYRVLYLTQGIQHAICSCTSFTLFPWETTFSRTLEIEEQDLRGPLPEDATAAIRRLHEVNERCREREGHDLHVYKFVIEDLEKMLSCVYGGMEEVTVAVRWIARLPPRFIELLCEREHLALIMIAHYGVAFQHLKPRWCFDAWCIGISKAAWATLDDEWRPLVHWAMNKIIGANCLEKVGLL